MINIIEEYMLRNAGGDHLADLAVAIDRKDPAMGEEFSSLLKKNPDKLEALDKALQDKPGAAGGLLDLLDKDPQKLQSGLQGIVSDPDSMEAFVTDAGIVIVQDNASPAARAKAEKALAAGVGAAIRKTFNPDANDSIRLKMEKLRQVEGFSDLMKSIGKNPAVADMFKRLTDGSAAQQEHALDGVLAQSEKDPQVFRKMLETMKSHPGSVTSLAAGIANDRGLDSLGAAGKDGTTRILDTILQDGGLDKVIDGFLDVPGEHFAASPHLLQMSNKGPAQLSDFIKGTGAKPQSVVSVDSHSGHVNTQAGSEFIAWAETQAAMATASATTKESAASKPKAPQS